MLAGSGSDTAVAGVAGCAIVYPAALLAGGRRTPATNRGGGCVGGWAGGHADGRNGVGRGGALSKGLLIPPRFRLFRSTSGGGGVMRVSSRSALCRHRASESQGTRGLLVVCLFGVFIVWERRAKVRGTVHTPSSSFAGFPCFSRFYFDEQSVLRGI